MFTFFYTFSAAGLYYLAELVEEFTVATKKIITALICLTTAIYVLFIFFDRLPWSMVICGLAAQLAHGLIMTNFPYVQFLSIPFGGAVGMLIVNHWLAFSFFSQNWYQFSEVFGSERRNSVTTKTKFFCSFLAGSVLFHTMPVVGAIFAIRFVECQR